MLEKKSEIIPSYVSKFFCSQ